MKNYTICITDPDGLIVQANVDACILKTYKDSKQKAEYISIEVYHLMNMFFENKSHIKKNADRKAIK